MFRKRRYVTDGQPTEADARHAREVAASLEPLTLEQERWLTWALCPRCRWHPRPETGVCPACQQHASYYCGIL